VTTQIRPAGQSAGNHAAPSKSVRVTPASDPLTAAVALARSGLAGEYLLYEQEGCWNLAAGVLGSVTVRHDAVTTAWPSAAAPGERATARGDAHPVRALGAALRALPADDWHAFGWIAFESALGPGGHPTGQPLAYMFVPRLEARIDATGARVRSADPGLLAAAAAVLESGDGPPDPVTRPVDVEAGARAYQRAVAEAVRRIRGGELAKVILSRAVEVPFAVDFPGTYQAGRRANTPARSFLIDLPGLQAAGFSPETVAEVSAQRLAVAQPLAGTRARYTDQAADRRSRAELAADPKEVYEHAVSVKLADAELRAICRPGTVAVSEFMVLKERGSVHHLGSRVHGRLSDEHTEWDALAALFPAVTASGIPKARAYDLIAELEPEPRGLYSGAVLRANSAGELDAALALRTVYTQRGRTWLRAGAGIVSASEPGREFRETCEKLASVAPYLVPLTR
jgi:salicylate synthase